MKEFIGSGAKTYSYLLNDGCEDKKKAKGTKKCYIKKPSGEINMIALSSNSDKRMLSIDSVMPMEFLVLGRFSM